MGFNTAFKGLSISLLRYRAVEV